MTGPQPDAGAFTAAVARIDALAAERRALPFLSARRWRKGRELRKAIQAAVPASKGSGR